MIRVARLTLLGGVIHGGTVDTAGSARLVGLGGTLDGVTVNGQLELPIDGAALVVTNGLTLNGTAYVGGTNGERGALFFAGTQTLGGSGEVVFGPSSANGVLVEQSGTTLTIGAGITIHGENGVVGAFTRLPWYSPADVMVNNQGLISADVPGGVIQLDAMPFSNGGFIEASNAGFVTTDLIQNGAGGTLLADGGTIMINDPVAVNQGTIATGAEGGTILCSSNLVLSPSSVLNFALAGKRAGLDYGHLSVVADLDFDGTLAVGLTNGFIPVVGDTFSLVSYGSRSDGFRQVQGLGLGGDPFLQVFMGERELLLVTKSLFGNPVGQATNLVNQVRVQGATTRFYIEPLGQAPFTYQWRFDGSDIGGATDSTLTLNSVQSSDAGIYSVLVTDGLGIQTSYSASLTVLAAPAITSQPSSQRVTPGTTIILTSSATGSGPLQYQWRLNGANIPDATNATYSISNAQPASGGSYSVSVGNAVDAVASDVATVVVASPALPLADNFAGLQNTNTLSGVGSGSNTNATSEAGEPLHAGKQGGKSVWYGWRAPATGVATISTRGSSFDTLLAVYTGASLNNLDLVAADDDSGGFFTSALKFQANAGTTYPIAIDGLGGRDGQIVLSWDLDTNLTAFPQILSQPSGRTAMEGGMASFTVEAVSTQELSYQWIFNDFLAIPGATNSTLTLTNVQATSAGRYVVEVSTPGGERVRSSGADLEVGPDTQDLSEDKFVSLFDHSGTSPVPASRKIKPAFPSVSAGTLGTQHLNNFNASTDEGEPLHAGVIGGSSRWFLLRAVQSATMVIDTMGSDIDTVLAIYTGTNLFTLQEVVSDNNGGIDGVRSRVRFEATGGVDYLVAIDGVNGAQGNIVLNWRMGGTPVIRVSPSDQTVAADSTASFEVDATGVPDPVYQWQFNGRNVLGATNAVWRLVNVTVAAAGSYRVIVDNQIDAVASEPALLRVVQQPLALEGASVGITNGVFRLVLDGNGEQSVVIEATTTLGDPSSWVPLWTNSPGVSEFLDPTTTQHPLRFYRARTLP